MPIPTQFLPRIAELGADHTSGATELAKHAAAIFLQLTDPQAEIPGTELSGGCTDIAYALVRSQPTMAPLLSLVNRVLAAVRQSANPDELRDLVRSLARSLISQLDTSNTRIALHAEPLVGDGTTILTHSHSSAVKKTLLKARDAGRTFSVVCTESRPMLEGVELSRELAGRGIAVTLIADAAAGSVVHEVQAILVGADSVSGGGVVNKIGTSGLALTARAMKIPFYVLCGTEKFIPERLVKIEQTKAAEELLPNPIAHVSVRNFYFDATPLEHLTGIITEEGIQSISSVRSILASVEKGFILRPEDLSSS